VYFEAITAFVAQCEHGSSGAAAALR
jgi:hypothetical protein